MDIRAYQPYTLVGLPVRGVVQEPLAVYSSTTVYKRVKCLAGFIG